MAFHPRLIVRTVCLLSIGCCLSLALHCSKNDISNPADPGYVGDYRLAVSWSALPDTLLVDTLYHVRFITGHDPFLNVQITLGDSAALDHGLFDSTITADSAELRFTGAYKGWVWLVGMRQNGRTVRDSAYVLVVSKSPCPGPHFATLQKDTVALKGDTLAVSAATVVPGCKGSAPAKWFWNRSHPATADSTLVPSYSYVPSAAGTDTILVHCRDAAGAVTAVPETISVTVSLGRPSVLGFGPDTFWAGFDTAFTVSAADPGRNGRVDSFFVRWNAGAPFERSDTSLFHHAFAAAGRCSVSVVVANNNADFSDTQTYRLYSLGHRPVVSAVSPDTTWAPGTTQFTFSVSDTCPLDHVDSIFVQWNNAGPFTASNTLRLSYNLIDTGTLPVAAYAKDHAGFFSDTARFSVRALGHVPVIDSVSIDTTPAAVFVLDIRRFTVHARDLKGGLAVAFADWNNDGKADDSARFNGSGSVLFAHSFKAAEAGSRTLRFTVADSSGLVSPAISLPVTVRLGKPRIAIIAGQSDTVSVRQHCSFRFSASDTNGTIRNVFVSWNATPFAASDTAIVDSFLSPGRQVVRAYAIDNDSIASDTVVDSFYVKWAKPVVDSITVDTNVSFIFINDIRSYTVHAHDVNPTSSIVQYKLSLDGGYSFGQAAKDTVLKDTAFSVSTIRYASALVIDNLGNVSDTAKTSFLVRQGTPAIAAHPDTFYQEVPNAVSNMPSVMVTLPAYDTNGTIVRWEWRLSGMPVPMIATSIDTAFLPIQQENCALPCTVTVVDDDSLRSSVIFHVYPDGPPMPPIPVSPVGGEMVSASTVTFSWAPTLDIRDSMQTKFAVLLKDSEATVYDTIARFDTAGAYPRLADGSFSYVWNPSSLANPPHSYSQPPSCVSGVSQTYDWMVVATDRWGNHWLSKYPPPSGMFYMCK